MDKFNDMEPREVFHWFREISNIPRCSGDEKRISDFLVKFAEDRELEVIQDQLYNVIIRKPASKGYENRPGVIIQGHMDMVCEKTETSKHDFTKDPIEWRREGDHLYANDTSLGGDDGIAVAYALAILDSSSIEHPDLEVLITTVEETGMDGANAVKAENLQGQVLLNIDAEDEGIFLASCSGGANSYVSFEKEYEDYDGSLIDINISGLLGGHSGMEIEKQRANSIKLVARLLKEVSKHTKFRLVELEAGSKHNAIPNKANFTIWLEDDKKIEEALDSLIADMKLEFHLSDPDLDISYGLRTGSGQAYSEDLSVRLMNYMLLIPHGVRDMSLEIKGLVQTSFNDGVIINRDEEIVFMGNARSNIGSLLENLLREIESLAELLGAKAWREKEYPAWEFVEESEVRDLAVEVYEKLYNKKPLVSAAHCGLETGVLNAIKPGMDILSYGPDLMDVHSVNEHLSIASVERVWNFTKALLREIK